VQTPQQQRELKISNDAPYVSDKTYQEINRLCIGRNKVNRRHLFQRLSSDFQRLHRYNIGSTTTTQKKIQAKRENF
jgi:hypothetical protein